MGKGRRMGVLEAPMADKRCSGVWEGDRWGEQPPALSPGHTGSLETPQMHRNGAELYNLVLKVSDGCPRWLSG